MVLKLFQVWQVMAKHQSMPQSVFSQWLKILTDDAVIAQFFLIYDFLFASNAAQMLNVTFCTYTVIFDVNRSNIVRPLVLCISFVH